MSIQLASYVVCSSSPIFIWLKLQEPEKSRKPECFSNHTNVISDDFSEDKFLYFMARMKIYQAHKHIGKILLSVIHVLVDFMFIFRTLWLPSTCNSIRNISAFSQEGWKFL